MSTPSRIDINRANAQHSTGPKTAEGKQKSSLNAFRHGLTSQSAVMPTEDLAAYQSHLAEYTDRYQPQDVTEADLVQSLADCSWRLNRVAALETNVLAEGTPLAQQAKTISHLSMHTQRLSLQYERALTKLCELQKIRRAQEQSDLSDLLDIMEMSEDKGETYDPSEDGFVFSAAQIATAQRARTRDRRALDACDYINPD